MTEDGGPHVSRERLRSLGAIPGIAVPDRINAWVVPDRLEATARALRGVRLQGIAATPHSTGLPGDGLTGADTYIAGGDDGTGIGVAIIDTGFGKLDLYESNGWIPSGYVEHDFHDGRDFGDHDSLMHGTFCFQTAAINAPGATYHLYLFDSGSVSTTAVLQDIAGNPDIDVVSYSFADFNEGWEDNSGNTNAGIEQVTAAGKLFFCAGGNFARHHWQGSFSDADANLWHEWSGIDERAGITIPDSASIGGYLCWDQSVGLPDYDLFLVDSTGTVLDMGDNWSVGTVGDFERVAWLNDTGDSMRVDFLVRPKASSPTPEFELFLTAGVGNDTFEHQISAGSTTSPVNSTVANCISIAAVDDDDYSDSDPSATGYSSHGPTNGGAFRPDLTGPTGTLVGASGQFIGTSASCPNVAGAAATLWSSAPYLDATGVRLLLVRQAQIYKDWGDAGEDNVFGQGGVFLAPWAWGTRWIDRVYGDPSGVAHRPYKFVADARDAAPAGGRLLFLGGAYPEPVEIPEAAPRRHGQTDGHCWRVTLASRVQSPPRG